MQNSTVVQQTARPLQDAPAIHKHRETPVLNLTFHGVGEPAPWMDRDEHCYWLNVGAFERVLDHVSEWPNTRISFDDGNMSDLSLALPHLEEHSLRASFFVVASRIGMQGYLGRDGLRELLAAGMEIGSHGMHHRSWRGLGARDLQQEIAGAKARIEDLLGRPVTQAACPFGHYDRRALHHLKTCGFTRVYTSDRGWARSDAWMQPRNTVTSATTPQDLEQVRSWSWPRRLTHDARLKLKCFR